MNGCRGLLWCSVSKWCNAKFLLFCSDEETSSSISWMACTSIHFQQIFNFGWAIPLINWDKDQNLQWFWLKGQNHMISPAPRPQLCYPAGAYRGAVVAGDPHGAGSVLCALELERTCSNSGDLSAELMTGMFFKSPWNKNWPLLFLWNFAVFIIIAHIKFIINVHIIIF